MIEDSFQEAVKRMIEYPLQNIHTAIPARIETYDPLRMRAEVTPLAKWVIEKDGKPVSMPKIIEVPVGHLRAGCFIIRPPYKPGDVVLVVFSEKALDNLMLAPNPTDPDIKRRHSIDDAIVIQGLQTAEKALTHNDHTDCLYIGNLQNDTEMYFEPGGDIIIQLDSIAKLYLAQPGATHPVAFADVIKQIYDGHTHPSPCGGTSSPNQKMVGHDSPQVFTE